MKRYLAAVAVGGGLVLAGGAANAQAIISEPGRHVSRTDTEVHGVLGTGYRWNRGWWTTGWGVGLRVGIPLMDNGPVRTINNSLVFNFGGELLFWDYYYRDGYWGAAAELIVPLELQWNFYLLPAFSLFLEGGAAIGWAGCGDAWCGFGIWPGLALGGRIHFNGRADYPALVFRFGFPVGFTLGVAF
jgi:hypothetical protein